MTRRQRRRRLRRVRQDQDIRHRHRIAMRRLGFGQHRTVAIFPGTNLPPLLVPDEYHADIVQAYRDMKGRI